MRRFAQLYAELDASTSTRDKLDALKRYYAVAPAADAAWATYFLAGGKPRQVVPTKVLRAAALQASGLAPWLFEECYQAVGDLAETIADVLPPPVGEDDAGLAQWVQERLAPLRGLPPADAAARLCEAWSLLDWAGRFLLVKLIGGAFRVGVSRLMVQRSLAEHAGLDVKQVAGRMMGYTDAQATPTAARFLALVEPGEGGGPDRGQPYPFFLAHALSEAPQTLGPPQDWLVEWKYDGIRAQLVRRAGTTWLWSRGEELVTDRFPELQPLGAALPDGTVLDGELLVWEAERPQPFARLQTRVGRKSLSRKLLAETPVAFVAFDLLEEAGTDLRPQSQRARRRRLEALHARVEADRPGLGWRLSPLLQAADWPAYAALLDESRARGVEGFMLKHVDAAYGVGRTKAGGAWWKWKIEPYAIDCVLVYAQRGHGRRASLYTDYTFAVWEEDAEGRRLVPFAKAYSGLTDEEFRAVDAEIRRTTVEKFGPVRSVRPTMVFELGFEGIQASSRHKSGIAVRFPRILRRRTDKKIEDADTLADLKALLAR